MKRLIRIFLFSIVVIIGTVFAVRNAELVQLDFYFFSFDIYISLAIIIAIITGVGLGVLAAVGWIVRTKTELVRLRRNIKNTEQELNNLRTIPIREDH